MRWLSMTRNANIHVRTDQETKSGAEQLFSLFGISVSDAINIFLRQSLLVGGLPFEVRQPRFNAETEAAMGEARDIMRGKTKAKTYRNKGGAWHSPI
jgi:DNA-damage-inducible protein J